MNTGKLESLTHVFYELESGIADRGRVIRKLSQVGISEGAATKFIDDTETMPDYALSFIRGLLVGSGEALV
jgi:hypothetical protein